MTKCLYIYIYDYMCILYIYCSIPKFQVFVFPCLELSLPATGFATFFFVPTTAPLQAAKSFKIGHQVLTDTKWGHLTVTFVGS